MTKEDAYKEIDEQISQTLKRLILNIGMQF